MHGVRRSRSAERPAHTLVPPGGRDASDRRTACRPARPLSASWRRPRAATRSRSNACLRHLAGKGRVHRNPRGPLRAERCRPGVARRRRCASASTSTGIGGRLAFAWGTLPTYVRTGAPGYHELFGMGFWDDLAAHPEVGASFDALMGPEGHGPADPEIPGQKRLALGADGRRRRRRARERCSPRSSAPTRGSRGRWSTSRAPSPALVRPLRRPGVADRVSVVAQSFFDPLPVGADLYLLRKVINDWPDPQAIAILRRCAEAARPGGRVVSVGGRGPAGRGPEEAHGRDCARGWQGAHRERVPGARPSGRPGGGRPPSRRHRAPSSSSAGLRSGECPHNRVANLTGYAGKSWLRAPITRGAMYPDPTPTPCRLPDAGPVRPRRGLDHARRQHRPRNRRRRGASSGMIRGAVRRPRSVCARSPSATSITSRPIATA